MTDDRIHEFYAEPGAGKYRGFYIIQQERSRIDGSWSLILTDDTDEVSASGESKGKALVDAFDQIDEMLGEELQALEEEESSQEEELFGSLSAQLYYKKTLLSELQERKEEIKRPEKPKGPISFKEAKEINKRDKEYAQELEDLANRISALIPEIEKIEEDVKREIPMLNTKIQITGRYNGQDYDMIVEHIQKDKVDRIEISGQ